MSSHIFLTGFPGFIAKRLVDRLLRKDPEARITFLIQEHLAGVAQETIRLLGERHPGFAGRAQLLPGDITRTLLGLSQEEYHTLAASITHVWHLAAIYDLSVHQSTAYRVNVLGTANVLDLCQASPRLKRLDYVSTCYVSGRRTGLVLESELELGQDFKNHYESTKCWAELEVRRRMHLVPTVIHRPAIVVGDSRTGETDKYDGPYYVIKALNHLPSWLPMVNLGEGQARVNLVPVDFLVDAMAEIWVKEEATGRTVHLADPSPHTSREVMEMILESMGFRRPLASLPAVVAEKALSVEPLRNLMQIPQEAVIYFNHEALYDTENQRQLLQGTGVYCPDILSVLPAMVSYVKQHPDKPFLDGRSF